MGLMGTITRRRERSGGGETMRDYIKPRRMSKDFLAGFVLSHRSNVLGEKREVFFSSFSEGFHVEELSPRHYHNFVVNIIPGRRREENILQTLSCASSPGVVVPGIESEIPNNKQMKNLRQPKEDSLSLSPLRLLSFSESFGLEENYK